MAKAQYFNRRPDDGLMHPAEINAARLLSKQVAGSRQRKPVGNRKQTTQALAVPGAPAVASGLTLSTSNPVAETAGATATPGVTGLAADAGHVHALAAGNGGSPPAIGTGTDGVSANVARADHTHSLPATGVKVNVSSGDTTADYLFSKLAAGTNVTLTKNNAGANETITIAATGAGINPTGYLDGCVLSWVSTTSVQVGTGSAYSTAAAALLTVSSPITFAYAPVALTDLAIDASNNKLVSSVTHSFVTADIGMELNVTSGTGFTVQHVTIDSVSGGKATLHASAGTLSSTNGHATLQMKPSTFYYVSLATNSTVSVSPTAPTNYQGTAWQDASTHRYVGAFLTDSSSNIYQWVRVGSLVRYKTSVNLSPFAVLSAGAATTSTSVSCSGCVPPTSMVAVADIFVQAPVAGCSVYFGSSDGTGTVSSTNYDEVCTASASVGYQAKTPAMNLNTSQALLYLINNAGSALYLKILGYLEPL